MDAGIVTVLINDQGSTSQDSSTRARGAGACGGPPFARIWVPDRDSVLAAGCSTGVVPDRCCLEVDIVSVIGTASLAMSEKQEALY